MSKKQVIKKARAARVKDEARAARVKDKARAALQIFGRLAQGLVKVWHKNNSFIISKQDAVNLTIEQLEQLVNEKGDTNR